MNKYIESKQVKVLHKTYTIKIYPDDNPINPREDCDNLGTIIYWSNRYNLGEIDGKKENIDAKDFANQKVKEGAVILPVYLYDHSGITINTTGFSCQWDSGHIGWIFADKNAIRKWFEVKNITKKLRDKVQEHLVNEVETFDKFYGFTVEDEDGNDIDSCWSFYIDSCWSFYDSKECMEEAEANVPSEQDILNDTKEKEKQQEEALQNLVGIA